MGFFLYGSLHLVFSKGRFDVLEKGIPQPFWFPCCYSIFLLFLNQKGIKKSCRGMIPFTTPSVQGQASFEGGGKKYSISTLWKSTVSAVASPCLCSFPWDGAGVLGTLSPQWDPYPQHSKGSRAGGVEQTSLAKTDEKQTEQPGLALNKYSVKIQKPR